jgi:hypothetical protein
MQGVNESKTPSEGYYYYTEKRYLKKMFLSKSNVMHLQGIVLKSWYGTIKPRNLISSILGGTPGKTKIPWILHQGWDQRASHAKWSVLRIKKKKHY